MYYFVFSACKLPVINLIVISAQIYFKSRVTIQYNIQEAVILSNPLGKMLAPGDSLLWKGFAFHLYVLL